MYQLPLVTSDFHETLEETSDIFKITQQLFISTDIIFRTTLKSMTLINCNNTPLGTHWSLNNDNKSSQQIFIENLHFYLLGHESNLDNNIENL